eukprot:4286022-Pyramimonas_sp.AAC.1
MFEQSHPGHRSRGRHAPRVPGLGQQRVTSHTLGQAGHGSGSGSRRGHAPSLPRPDLAHVR